MPQLEPESPLSSSQLAYSLGLGSPVPGDLPIVVKNTVGRRWVLRVRTNLGDFAVTAHRCNRGEADRVQSTFDAIANAETDIAERGVRVPVPHIHNGRWSHRLADPDDSRQTWALRASPWVGVPISEEAKIGRPVPPGLFYDVGALRGNLHARTVATNLHMTLVNSSFGLTIPRPEQLEGHIATLKRINSQERTDGHKQVLAWLEKLGPLFAKRGERATVSLTQHDRNLQNVCRDDNGDLWLIDFNSAEMNSAAADAIEASHAYGIDFGFAERLNFLEGYCSTAGLAITGELCALEAGRWVDGAMDNVSIKSTGLSIGDKWIEQFHALAAWQPMNQTLAALSVGHGLS